MERRKYRSLTYVAVQSPVSIGSAWPPRTRLPASGDDGERETRRPHIASPPASRIHHRRQALPVLHPEAASLICLPACLANLAVSVDCQRASHLVGLPFRRRRSQVDSHLISASWRCCHTPLRLALIAWTDMDIVSIWPSPLPLRLISCLSACGQRSARLVYTSAPRP